MRVRTTLAAAGAGVLVGAAALSGCGLTSGSPMVDDVKPGSIGRGLPLKGASLTVTSKQFTEQIILGQMMGLAFKAAGASVLDRTDIQGSIGAREAVKSGSADGMYEYTGTAWITYLGHTKPIPSPQKQWQAVHDADLRNGITWLPPARLNNTYALAANKKNAEKYHLKDLSDVARLAKQNPSAATVCVEAEFAVRNDGLPGVEKAYGFSIPPSHIRKMDSGVVYTQVSGGRTCTLGEVFTTDGRIPHLGLKVLTDNKKFFPNYNAAPEMYSKAMKEHPAIAKVLDPITKKLTTQIAQQLNAKVDVEGQDPHEVAKAWLIKEGFIKKG
ncbi:glycine betaine ABC transporter substrate-binding protein [Streptomyces sp. NBC_01089]|uniref:glycine betaine ABC transporter substrate-binding protein n=1 Tax=Streptomyces sp. NBC_01089 TaxID=2903747 RepID=UPI00386B670C|nr:glycine betaine ABC transporter substrate-binding protein [Streptomyces sp. NBC_01089]